MDTEMTYGLRSLMGSTDGTCAGNATTKISFTNTPKRAVVTIKNHSSTLNIWVDFVNRGGSAPSISSTVHAFLILPGTTQTFAINDSIDIYIENSAGDASTANYSARAFAY